MISILSRRLKAHSVILALLELSIHLLFHVHNSISSVKSGLKMLISFGELIQFHQQCRILFLQDILMLLQSYLLLSQKLVILTLLQNSLPYGLIISPYTFNMFVLFSIIYIKLVDLKSQRVQSLLLLSILSLCILVHTFFLSYARIKLLFPLSQILCQILAPAYLSLSTEESIILSPKISFSIFQLLGE